VNAGLPDLYFDRDLAGDTGDGSAQEIDKDLLMMIGSPLYSFAPSPLSSYISGFAGVFVKLHQLYGVLDGRPSLNRISLVLSGHVPCRLHGKLINYFHHCAG